MCIRDRDGSFKSEQFYSEEGLREFVRFIESSREHLINDEMCIRDSFYHFLYLQDIYTQSCDERDEQSIETKKGK